MVKKYSDLYLDARKALLPGEGQQRAGSWPGSCCAPPPGKSQEEILSRRDQYAPEEVCRTMEDFTGRALAGEPLAYILEEWDFLWHDPVCEPGCTHSPGRYLRRH